MCASQDIGMLIVGTYNQWSLSRYKFYHGEWYWLAANVLKICSAQVPVYLSELAPPSKRGPSCGSPAMGNHMGYYDHVLHHLRLQLYQSNRCVPCSVGLQMIPAILLFIGMLYGKALEHVPSTHYILPSNFKNRYFKLPYKKSAFLLFNSLIINSLFKKIQRKNLFYLKRKKKS